MSRSSFLGFAFALLLLSHSGTTQARTWYIVPDGSGDAPTILAATDSAAPGDTVLLDAGTYFWYGNVEADLPAKPITVRSESGPAVTIVDASGEGFGLSVQGGIVLDGITLRNASSEGLIIYGSCLIRNCVVINNGRGIRCYPGADAVLDSCVIESNGKLGSYDGSGLHNDRGSVVLTNCIIRDNGNSDNSGTGAGIYSSRGDTELRDCEVVLCSTLATGGGIYSNYGTLTVVDSRIDSNFAGSQAGGIYSYSRLFVDSCIISHNSGSNGGGFKIHSVGDSSQVLTHCLIANNTGDVILSESANLH